MSFHHPYYKVITFCTKIATRKVDLQFSSAAIFQCTTRNFLRKNNYFFSGKSTLAALLLRLYDPDKGQIVIDNHDIKLLDLSWLRKQIGTVTQEPILFSSTIRDNISYGADNPEAQCSKNEKIVQ